MLKLTEEQKNLLKNYASNKYPNSRLCLGVAKSHDYIFIEVDDLKRSKSEDTNCGVTVCRFEDNTEEYKILRPLLEVYDSYCLDIFELLFENELGEYWVPFDPDDTTGNILDHGLVIALETYKNLKTELNTDD